MLAFGSDDVTVMIWDVKMRVILHSLKGHTRWVYTVVFSSNSKLITSGSINGIPIWDTRDGKQLYMLEHSSGFLSFCTDGLLIA